jgi:hypothetical protein
MVVTGGTAGFQALSGDTAGATQTLMNMGLPMLGNSGGKVLNNLSQNGGRVLSNLADVSTNPAASRMMGNMGDLLNNRAVQNTLNATATGVRTLGMSAPTVIAGKQVMDVFNQWNSGALGPDGKPIADAGDLIGSFGNLLGSGYGFRAQQRMNRNALNNPNAQGNPEFGVPTRQDPKMAPGEVKIDGYRNGMPVVRHGGDVDPATLKIHQDMAWQTGRDWNPMSRLGGALNPFNAGNPLNPLINRALGLPTATGPAAPRFGSQGYEFKMEDIKHRQMAESNLARAQELRQQGDVAGANRLELQAQQYRLQADQYAAIANDPTQRNLRGDNYIAADRELDLEQRNLLPREVATQIQQDPRVLSLSQEMTRYQGTRESPIIVPDGPGILGLGNHLSSGQRQTAPWQGNYYQIGSTRVYEQQRRGVNNAFLNFHPSSYDGISSQIITPMMQRTGMSDGDVAGALRDYTQGGRNSLDPKLHPYIQEFDRLRVLMFGRESIRNPSNIVQAPMTLDLIANPRDPMTWHEAFAGYQGTDRLGGRGVFPMSMVGGNPAARVLNNEYQQRLTGETPEGAKPPSLKDFNRAQELVQREQALTDRWLKAHGIEDLNDPQAARELMMRRTEDFYFGSPEY